MSLYGTPCRRDWPGRLWHFRCLAFQYLCTGCVTSLGHLTEMMPGLRKCVLIIEVHKGIEHSDFDRNHELTCTHKREGILPNWRHRMLKLCILCCETDTGEFSRKKEDQSNYLRVLYQCIVRKLFLWTPIWAKSQSKYLIYWIQVALLGYEELWISITNHMELKCSRKYYLIGAWKI